MKWVVTAQTAPGRTTAVSDWFAAWDPVRLEPEAGLAPRSLRVDFDRLQGPWRVLKHLDVHHMVLTPEGVASLIVKDDPARVRAFMLRIATDGDLQEARIRDHYGGKPPERAGLTPRQAEVLALAVALGYYDVPRRLTLRQLAAYLGLSLGATSELVRRAEALVVSSYVDSMLAEQADSTGASDDA